MKPLPGFDHFPFASGGIAHDVYVRGSGPGVLLMHELPGMVTQCVDLGTFIADRGFTVFMPLLFGQAGGNSTRMRTATLFAQVCISREFRCFAQGESSPVTGWLRALCMERIRPKCPGPGIGAIGMCFTGGFVLSLFVSDIMLAPVLSQPGLPFGVTSAARRALGVSECHLAEASASHVPILGFRFKGDRICPPERFETLRQRFGGRFEGHELPGDQHSVLTIHFVDKPGEPTFAARERVIQFLRTQLHTAAQ